MRHRTFVLVTTAAMALAAPALASAAPSASRGVVVQRDARAGSLVLAMPSGALKRVQHVTSKKITMGAVLQLRGSKISVVGHAHRAKVRGVVLRNSRNSFALAGNGSVLAVNTTAPPPAAGQQITTTVQVAPTQLSDDGGVQVEDTQAPSAELRGTVLSQDATTLKLTVPGFPAGLTIALGTQTIPVLPVGTQVEAHVAIAPDPANPAGIILTLVSLHVENGGPSQGGDQGSMVKAEGQVTAVTEAGPTGGTPGSITIAGEHGTVTFVIPAGFGPTGVAVNDQVEARGTPGATPDAQPTLVRIEGQNSQNSQGNQGEDSGDDDGGSGPGHAGSGTIGGQTGGTIGGQTGGGGNAGPITGSGSDD